MTWERRLDCLEDLLRIFQEHVNSLRSWGMVNDGCLRGGGVNRSSKKEASLICHICRSSGMNMPKLFLGIGRPRSPAKVGVISVCSTVR